MSWQDIPGFSTDIPELYRSWVDESEAGDTIVEVGVYKGRSLAALRRIVADRCRLDLDLYGIDLWEDLPDDFPNDGPGEYPRSTMYEAINNVLASPKRGAPTVTFLKCPSDNAFLADYVFIDADHRYESVKRDIEAWLPRTRKVLAGHDYCASHPGVMRAVDELLPGRELRGCCWVWRIR